MPGAIVIGAGPGLGTSVARRLAREGLAVAVLARSRATVAAAVAALADAPAPALGLTADVTDEAALRAALDEAVARFGVPEVLVYNAALIQRDAVGELSAAGHLEAWAVNVVGAITAAAHLGPAMAQAGRGTILLTGGMPEPIPEVTSLSLGKAGVRALAELLARAYEPAGVHVATVTVAGAVAPASPFDPDEIAEQYWQLHAQPAGAWEREVLYSGRTTAQPAPAPPPDAAR
jgi:NAD(P)-dependent dehydrogenase (short-subunit alcohol dehydrogenase family)